MLALALALAAALPAQTVEIGRGVGQLFGDLELPTVDGQGSVRLSQLRGRRLLLIEFASW
jgi:hypothetical protein